MSGAISWYDANAASAADGYEALQPERLHGWLEGLHPATPGLVLDVGAGSGRDAVWLAGLGHDVVAAEPSAALLDEAVRRHPDVAVRWIADQLPGLLVIQRLGLSFDLILLSAVWQHILPADRPRAMRKLLGLLRPGGVLAITLRTGPAEAARGMHEVSLPELETLARQFGAVVVRAESAADAAARPGMSWINVALRLPDDGTGALPLLRHVILNDQKSATYKLGLLRALCRAADGQAGLAEASGDDAAILPLGLVVLNWLRLYLPLVAAGLPQIPRNAGPDGLGFAGSGFRALLAGAVPALDLRIGTVLSGGAAQAVRSALQEAADLITRMPAAFMTYPNGGPVLPTVRRRAPAVRDGLMIDASFLAGFGTMEVPRALWQALERFASWVEPALIEEWKRLMRGYALGQNRLLDEGGLAVAMGWSEPSRGVALPRERALQLIGTGAGLRCVWSGRRLEAETLDIDHCLPWSAWPCGDLWNLLPAHRLVNQREKRDRLPADGRLRAARPAIQDWWQQAYLIEPNGVLPRRFETEARASLPGLAEPTTVSSPAEVFGALQVQRLRLRHDQLVPEWAVPKPGSAMETCGDEHRNGIGVGDRAPRRGATARDRVPVTILSYLSVDERTVQPARLSSGKLSIVIPAPSKVAVVCLAIGIGDEGSEMVGALAAAPWFSHLRPAAVGSLVATGREAMSMLTDILEPMRGPHVLSVALPTRPTQAQVDMACTVSRMVRQRGAFAVATVSLPSDTAVVSLGAAFDCVVHGDGGAHHHWYPSRTVTEPAEGRLICYDLYDVCSLWAGRIGSFGTVDPNADALHVEVSADTESLLEVDGLVSAEAAGLAESGRLCLFNVVAGARSGATAVSFSDSEFVRQERATACRRGG